MPKAEKNKTHSDQPKCCGENAGTVIQFLIWVSASFAAIFTGYLAYVAHDTERRQLRAYIVPTTITLQCPDCTNPNYAAPKPGSGRVEAVDAVSVDVKAAGITPAYNVGAFIYWKPIPMNVAYPVGGVVYDEQHSGGAVIESRVALAPGDQKTFSRQIDVDQFADAKAMHRRLIVYGNIVYDDIFENAWSVDFCWVYEPVIKTGGDSFVACPEHTRDHPRSN
jgi:hypothetical protein